MKNYIRLSILNTRGSCAEVVNKDGHVTLSESYTKGNAKERCAQAAKTLRELADRFDALAKELDPFNHKTQKRLNKGEA
jgi:hypothetical protein